MTKAEEINNFMLETFEEHGIEDTTETRIAFLQGLQATWKEDRTVSLEKTFYQLALTSELAILRMKLSFELLA